MSTAQNNIDRACKWAFANRPKVNGFPFLAEALKQVGVIRYTCTLPSCQSIFFTKDGNVAGVSEALTTGMTDVPVFNREAFLKVLRASQAGDITFPEFLKGSWESGVIHYEADLMARKVTYYGAAGESYAEDYPQAEVQL